MASSGVRLLNIDFEQAIQASLREFPHIPRLKEEQKLCIQSVAKKRDVFGILPTGFGKSLIFQLLPRVLKESWKIERSTVIVVSPLVSIMKDQVEELSRLGLKTFALGLGDDEREKELRAREFNIDVMYGSPESWCSKEWSRELKEGQLGKQTVCLVVDETHSVSAW